jgi:two-component system, NarL family, invasion response regulator UvrY
MLKILVVDDHPIVRQGIKQSIQETGDIAIAGEAGNGEEALQKLAGGNFDLVILDISMPGKSGIDVIKEIRFLRPGLPVLILSMHPEKQFITKSFEAGACGYLTKDSAPNELLEAIYKTSRGEKFISSDILSKMVSNFYGDGEKLPHKNLSPREFQIMEMLAGGKTVTEISKELVLSVKTVSTHRSNILRKMNLRRNSELTRYAIQNNLIDI